MISEELEFQIVQYVDGELPTDARAALEARLATDAEARLVLDEHVKLRHALLQGTINMPIVNYEKFARHVSDVVAQSDEEVEKVYSLKWLKFAAPLAVAACVMIGFAVTMQSADPVTPVNPIETSPMVTNDPAPSVLDVRGPEINVAPGESFVDVQIGSGPASTENPAKVPFATDNPARQPSVMMLGPADNATRKAPTTQESDRFMN
jgi:hypothetical protein